MEKSFDCVASTVQQTHMDAILLSLCAVQVLNMEHVSNKVSWNIAWVDGDTPVFLLEQVWAGVNLHSSTRDQNTDPKHLLQQSLQ